VNGAWDTPTARVVRWERQAWRSGVVTGLIVYISGCVTMIAAGICLILLGPQG
jgi:hypothetical protein